MKKKQHIILRGLRIVPLDDFRSGRSGPSGLRSKKVPADVAAGQS